MSNIRDQSPNRFVLVKDEAQKYGDLGFGGINGCGQTKGARKVFAKGEDPKYILEHGLYNHIPMFFGANKDEGLLGYHSKTLECEE